MGTVTQLPEVGRRQLRLHKASVTRLPMWRFTFTHQSGISIWTEDPQRIDIIAPGSMKLREAIAWAKLRVPGSWLLVQAYREGGDNE